MGVVAKKERVRRGRRREEDAGGREGLEVEGSSGAMKIRVGGTG